MAEDFAELGLEGFNKATDKLFDKTYDKVNRGRKKMSGGQRYSSSSQPPAHRGYDDDPHNPYDDDEPRGPARYKESRGPGRYEQEEYIPRQFAYYDQPRFPDDRVPGGYNGTLPQDPSPSYKPAGVAPGAAMTQYSKRRSDHYDDRRSRRRHSQSRSRSDSRDGLRSDNRYKDSPSLAFDKSDLGLGVGIAGALIGGWVGRELGDDHKGRNTTLGAVLGGIGANLVEHRLKIYKEDQRAREEEEEEGWERRQSKRGSAYGYDDGSSSRRRR